jgi:hypothetical protein
MKSIIEKIKSIKYLKDYLFVAAAVIAGLLAVCGGGFADYAESKFWAGFWSVAAWVGFIVFAGGWVYLSAKDRAASKNNYRRMK